MHWAHTRYAGIAVVKCPGKCYIYTMMTKRDETMTEQICPRTGHPMVRDVRPMTIEYKGRSAVVQMPGWYCEHCDEGVHTADDMLVSDGVLHELIEQEKSQ